MTDNPDDVQIFRAIQGGLREEGENRGLSFQDIKEYRECATHILAEFYMSDGLPTLRHWQGSFWFYRDGVWEKVDEVTPQKDEIFHQIHNILSHSTKMVRRQNSGGEWRASRERVKPTSTLTNEIRTALTGLVYYKGEDMAWISGEGPTGIHSCLNGLVNIRTSEIIKPTPRFFNTRRLNATFRPEWMDDDDVFEAAWNASVTKPFFGAMFKDDPQQIDLLQEIIGYILFGGMEMEKIFQIVGPKRSGKGTTNLMLGHLLGAAAVAPSTKSLENDFGLQPLVNKLLATITDARIDRHTNFGALAENLLAISGGDPRDINRKHQTFLEQIFLSVRFLILSNSIAGLRDADGVLADRMIYLKTSTSFFGKEDTTLKKRIVEDADLWLAWAARGYLYLKSRNFFSLTDTHHNMRDRAKAKMAPIPTFLERFVVEDVGEYIPVTDLHLVFLDWASRVGIASWDVGRFVSTIHDRMEGATRPGRPFHTRENEDGRTTKLRERVVHGITWQEGKAPTPQMLAEFKDLIDDDYHG